MPSVKDAILVVLILAAAPTASGDPRLLALPSPADGGPVTVQARFELRDLNEIDDEREVFEFSGVLRLEWSDPRQAFDPVTSGVRERLYQGAYQFNETFTGWFPQIVLVNESGLYESHGVLLRVRPRGAITLVQTINAAAKADLDLRAYPFDRQIFEAVFTVLGHDDREVVLESATTGERPNHRGTGRIRVPQWRLDRVDELVRSQESSLFDSRGASSTFVVRLAMERKSLFIVRLVIIPLFLIVILSWSVFWMDHSSVGDRVNVSFIAILTVVAYQIVLSEILPRISYMTLMNGFLNMSFFVVCASVVVSLWVGSLDRRGLVDVGDRIDRRCRWIFPILYLGLLGVVVVATTLVTRAPIG